MITVANEHAAASMKKSRAQSSSNRIDENLYTMQRAVHEFSENF
jgi:hypothetical protein